MLDENKKSYFQNIIIWNRMLPIPNDLLEEVRYLHQELYMKDTSYIDEVLYHFDHGCYFVEKDAIILSQKI